MILGGWRRLDPIVFDLAKPSTAKSLGDLLRAWVDSPCFTQELDGRDAILDQLFVEIGQLEGAFGVGRAQAVLLDLEPVAQDLEGLSGLLQLVAIDRGQCLDLAEPQVAEVLAGRWLPPFRSTEPAVWSFQGGHVAACSAAARADCRSCAPASSSSRAVASAQIRRSSALRTCGGAVAIGPRGIVAVRAFPPRQVEPARRLIGGGFREEVLDLLDHGRQLRGRGRGGEPGLERTVAQGRRLGLGHLPPARLLRHRQPLARRVDTQPLHLRLDAQGVTFDRSRAIAECIVLEVLRPTLRPLRPGLSRPRNPWRPSSRARARSRSRSPATGWISVTSQTNRPPSRLSTPRTITAVSRVEVGGRSRRGTSKVIGVRFNCSSSGSVPLRGT